MKTKKNCCIAGIALPLFALWIFNEALKEPPATTTLDTQAEPPLALIDLGEQQPEAYTPPPAGMITDAPATVTGLSKAIRDYGFTNADDFFDYIVESKYNGQHGQVRELAMRLSQKERLQFWRHLSETGQLEKYRNYWDKVIYNT